MNGTICKAAADARARLLLGLDLTPLGLVLVRGTYRTIGTIVRGTRALVLDLVLPSSRLENEWYDLQECS